MSRYFTIILRLHFSVAKLRLSYDDFRIRRYYVVSSTLNYDYTMLVVNRSRFGHVLLKWREPDQWKRSSEED